METTNSLTLGILGIPPGPIMGMAFALVVLGLLLWGMKNPLSWVVVSVLFITTGVGCLVYGITDLITLNPHQSPLANFPNNDARAAAIFIGGGAGGAVGGAVLLLVTFLRRKKEGNGDART